jgi:hypothetical protein
MEEEYEEKYFAYLKKPEIQFLKRLRKKVSKKEKYLIDDTILFKDRPMYLLLKKKYNKS